MPTSWITLTPEQLDTAKAAALVAALRTAALGENQPDPVPEIITNVTARIRMEIAAGGRTVLDADATKLPPSLKSLGLRMVLREAQSRLNAASAMPLGEDEREEWRQDVRFLERIAKGDITVEEPTNPAAVSSVQAPTPVPMISARERTFSRRSQEGI